MLPLDNKFTITEHWLKEVYRLDLTQSQELDVLEIDQRTKRPLLKPKGALIQFWKKSLLGKTITIDLKESIEYYNV